MCLELTGIGSACSSNWNATNIFLSSACSAFSQRLLPFALSKDLASSIVDGIGIPNFIAFFTVHACNVLIIMFGFHKT